MSSSGLARRWVLAAAGTSFAAGLAVGMVVPSVVRAVDSPEPADSDARYVMDLVARYGLDSMQARKVQMVLEARNREHVRTLLRDLDRLPAQLRLEVLDANRRAEERIKQVLTDEQRARFLRDSELAPLADGAGRDGAPGSSNKQEDR